MSEIDKEAAAAVQKATTALNETIAVAVNAGLRVELDVDYLQRLQDRHPTPVLGAHVMRYL